MLTETQKKSVTSAKDLAKWFEIDFEIKIFGQTILSYHYPPANGNESRY